MSPFPRSMALILAFFIFIIDSPGLKIPLANARHLLDKLRFNIHTGLCILIMPTREIGYNLTNRLHIERTRIEKMLRERIFDLPNGGRWCENKGLIIFPARRALRAENGRGGILDTIATLYT